MSVLLSDPADFETWLSGSIAEVARPHIKVSARGDPTNP